MRHNDIWWVLDHPDTKWIGQRQDGEAVRKLVGEIVSVLGSKLSRHGACEVIGMKCEEAIATLPATRSNAVQALREIKRHIALRVTSATLRR